MQPPSILSYALLVRSLPSVALVLAACGHPATSTVTPGTGGAADAPTDLTPGPPLVTPGEHMMYRVSLRGIELAAYEIAVGDVVDLDGRKAIPVQCHAKLTGLGSLIGGNIDDHFTSWIDVETGKPLRFQADEYASKSKDIEHTVVDFAHRDGATVPVMFHINEADPHPEPQRASLPTTWDYNAFLVAMRSWEPPAGTRLAMEVFRSQYMWNVAVTAHGKTRLETELGELPALRFDGHTFKVARDGSKFPDTDERDFSLWISDDAGRVPLQINARTDYGDVKMQIVDYAPGNGEPLRK